MAAGAPQDDTGGSDSGAVFVVGLRRNGSAAGHSKIADGVNGLPQGTLGAGRRFGLSLTHADVDSDGTNELLVGAGPLDGGSHDALYVLWLNATGYCTNVHVIAPGVGGLRQASMGGNSYNAFGGGTVWIPELDAIEQDGRARVAIGAPNYLNLHEHTSRQGTGAVLMIELAPNGTVVE